MRPVVQKAKQQRLSAPRIERKKIPTQINGALVNSPVTRSTKSPSKPNGQPIHRPTEGRVLYDDSLAWEDLHWS